MKLLGTSNEPLIGLLIYVVGLLISLFVVMRLLTGRQSPAATLLWVVIIVAAPYFGVLLYYLLPHRIHLKKLKRRSARAASLAPSSVRGLASSEARDSAVAFLERIDPGVSMPGNRVELICAGGDFFSRLEEAIKSAKICVYVEMYIFRPDAIGLRLLRHLAEAATRGVDVRLLYDHIGSWALKSSHLAALEEAGGRSVSYAPLLWRRRPFTLNLRNHRKLILVDDCCAFLGGRNVANEYANDRWGAEGTWFDAMLEIRGPGVEPLRAVFAEDWYHASNERPSEVPEKRERDEPSNDASCWVGTVASGPDRERNAHRYLLFELIGRARDSIDISSPYLLPHPAIETALAAASIRGVRIRLHCNGPRVAGYVLYHAARSRYGRLLELGVEIIETIGDYNHAKMFIVDGKELLLSSANLDMRSFELNFELGALVVDTSLAEDARRVFEERASVGRKIDPRSFAVGPLGRLIDGSCRLLSPIL